jgi:branched-chain amino acid aminotransferase
MPVSSGNIDNALAALVEVGKKARVFVSMPIVEGITPRLLLDPERTRSQETGEGFERRHGIFRLDEIGLPLLDHDVLYGDACFEGILIKSGQVFLLREHLERLWRSAGALGIPIPYPPEDLAARLLETIREVAFHPGDNSYIRLVVTRGLGDLGINPRKCVGTTLFALVSTIRLYPPEAYEKGIALGIARSIRRPGASILDPRIKSNNYLNNVLALKEGCEETDTPECVMLTQDGFVAEATVDNIFVVVRRAGWESDPSRVRILTPAGEYCLNGITRGILLELARGMGYSTEESTTILPLDLVGEHREVFMTGTGAFVMPITFIAGHPVGDGRPGAVTRILLNQLKEAMVDPHRGLSLSAGLSEIHRYLG